MNKLINIITDYLKFITSTPSEREVKLLEFEHAEQMTTYHSKATLAHEAASEEWRKKRERARAELLEAVRREA